MSKKTYLDEEFSGIGMQSATYKGLFAGKRIKDEKNFSSKFMRTLTSDACGVPEKMGDGILNFGFAQDVAMESAVTTIKFRLKNPSQYYPMDNISVKLNIANGRPDKDGSLGAGSRSFANIVNPSITTLKNTGNSNITYDSASNVINIDKIKAGEEVDIDISICPPKGISKQLMRDFIGNEGLFEAYTNDFNNMYSWLEYEL